MYAVNHIIYNLICDRVCENQCYLHVKFDLILSLSNLITLFPNIASTIKYFNIYICDPPCENPPCSHLVVIRETGVSSF